MASILIVDDEKRVRDGIKLSLSGLAHELHEAESLEECHAMIGRLNPDLILLDVHFKGGATCIPFLERLQSEKVQIPLLVLSGAASAKEAAEAMKLGAYDFLEKPISADRLRVSVQNALNASKLKAKTEAATTDKNVRTDIIGESPSIQKVKDLINQFGRRDAKVLITGDTGTGKELVAHGIWRASTRAAKPFILINAAAIPETLIESELFGHQKGAFTGAVSNQLGKLEMADGGTVFLDEIGELSLMAQSKLLRFLETGEIQVLGSNKIKICDVRLIAATSRDLPAEIRAGRFREDLYFRLNVARIEIAALRERREDILPIFTHFVSSVCLRYNEPIRLVEESAKSALLNYPWPGNVRELRNVAERSVLLSRDAIDRKLILDIVGNHKPAASEADVDLPKSVDEVMHLKDYRKKAESRYVAHVLKLADGSVTKAAQILGVDRSHLHQKLKDFGLV